MTTLGRYIYAMTKPCRPQLVRTSYAFVDVPRASRSLAVEINAIKSGEAIYNPGIMLRLRDILLDRRRRAAKHKGDSMDVDGDGEDAAVPAADGDDQVKRDAAMEVEMKVGDMGENGKRTGGLALFKEKEEIVWRMTEEDLWLAAEGVQPPAQRRPLPPTPIALPVPDTPVISTPTTTPPATSNKVEFAKEDAPLQVQAPIRRITPEPPAIVDVEMDGPAPSSQPVSAGPSKRSTPVPSLNNSTRSTPQPQTIREDAPLQAQEPPVRLSPLPPVILPVQLISASPTVVVPPTPAPVPATVPVKESPTTSTPTAKAAGGRPMPRKRRAVRKGTSPPPEDSVTSDVVPDSQEAPASSPAAEESKAETPREKKTQRIVSGSRKRKAQDQDVNGEVDGKTEAVQPIEVDKEDADVVPSSTAGDDGRLVAEVDNAEPKKKHVSDQSSEDDLTPPPMSPNLPPVGDDSLMTDIDPTETPPRRKDKDEKARKSAAGPATRRGQAKEVREASLPARKRGVSRQSENDVSPVRSTLATKRQGTETRASEAEEAEEESQSEMEVTTKPKRRGRPKARGAEETTNSKKTEDEDQEQGSRRTRRQEMTKRPSTRNGNTNKADMSSPPAPTKRSSRPTPERQTRTRGNRTRAAKDKDEPDEGENQAEPEAENGAEEDEKSEEPSVIRRSGRRTRKMPDLREEDEDGDEDEEEADSAAEDVASPAATIDSDRRHRPRGRQREIDKGSAKKAAKDEATKKDGRLSLPPLTGLNTPAHCETRSGNLFVWHTSCLDQRQEDTEAAEDEREAPTASNEDEAVEDGQEPKRESPRPSPAPAGDGEEGDTKGESGALVSARQILTLSTCPTDEAESAHEEPTLTETRATRTTRSATNAITTETTTRMFKKEMNQLHQEILGHKHGPIFNAAVRAVSGLGDRVVSLSMFILPLQSDAPGYYDVVKKPMDLKKIKTNINKNVIKTIDDFQRDLYLMFW